MSLPKRSNSISSRRAQAKAEASAEEKEWLEGGKLGSLGSSPSAGMSRTSSLAGGGGETLFHYGEEDD